MTRKSFTEHPEFLTASQVANGALRSATLRMGGDLRDLDQFDLHASRVVDEMTKLLLRVLDAKRKAA